MKKHWTVNFNRQYKRFDVLPSICIEYSNWMDEMAFGIAFSWLFFECCVGKIYTKKE